MKGLLIVSIWFAVLLVGCVKPPDDLTLSFWDPEYQGAEIATVIDTSSILNNTNERYYSVRFAIDWDEIPVNREGTLLSVQFYKNGIGLPMQHNSVGRSSYVGNFFVGMGDNACVTFGFVTSTGGFTRQFDLMCI